MNLTTVMGLAAASAVCDFTRGAWKTAPKMPVIDIDLKEFSR